MIFSLVFFFSVGTACSDYLSRCVRVCACAHTHAHACTCVCAYVHFCAPSFFPIVQEWILMLDNIFLSSIVYLSYTFGQAIFNRIILYLESLFNFIVTLLRIDKTNIKITLTLQMKKLWTRGIEGVDKSRREVTFLASPEGLFGRLWELQIFMC